MGIGLGVQIMWPLAAQEAAAGGVVELEPGHFLCAALKLAELPAAAFEDIVPDKRLVVGLEDEQRRLCDALQSSGVHVPADLTPLRRRLRGLLRRGDRPRPVDRDGGVHRSERSKALFARAEAAAREAGERDLGVGRLMQTLLAEPDEALAAALSEVCGIGPGVRSAEGEEPVAWIEAFGRDLTRWAREQGADEGRLEVVRRDAVCRVLAEALFPASEVKSPPALLISEGERDAAAVVNDLALWLVSPKPPAGVSGGSILEIHSGAVLNRGHEGMPEARLEEVFQKAASEKSTVLFFDSFHRYLNPATADEGLARRYEALLRETKTKCVVGMTRKQYETHIEHVPSWRHVLRLIWIHDPSPRFQL